jgi:hypothetical protein
MDFETRAGPEAVMELAVAYSREISEEQPERLAALLKGDLNGLEAIFDVPDLSMSPEDISLTEPWSAGWRMAKNLRNKLSLADDPIDIECLSTLFKLKPSAFGQIPFTAEPISLGIRNKESSRISLRLRRCISTTLRFLLARLIGDYLSPLNGGLWLTATKGRTLRQKIQRAFAAEFLRPFQSLIYKLSADFSEESLESASGYFQVSPLPVSSQLVNRKYLPPYSQTDFP